MRVVTPVPPSLRPDPGPAETWLRRELAHAAYQPSLLERVQRGLDDLLARAGGAAGSLAGLGWPALVLILVLLVGLGAVVLSRVRRNPLAPPGPVSVFDDVRRPAAEHRRLADAAFADADWDTAAVEAVRALSAGLVERGVAPDDPTVTVREVTAHAAARFPRRHDELEAAARVFEETRYGGRSSGRAAAAACLELEEALRRSPGPVAADGGSGPVLAVPR